MWRRKRIVIAALVAVAVLVSGTAGVAFAQAKEEGSAKTLVARVAQILGIEEQKVQNAFDQARKEIGNEALDNYLKWAVDKGRITQEQADKYKNWWQSRPASPELKEWQQARPDIPLLRGPFGRSGFKGFGHGFRGW